MRLTTLVLLALPLPTAHAQENLLIVVADDLGVDMLACYGEGQDLPATPTIDGLARDGLAFRNCWANPVCSPTRASVQTGRYSFRTGIGMIIAPDAPDLQLSELLLPEVLALQPDVSWSCAAIGKWHLGGFGNTTHPNDSGYAYFSGSLHNLPQPGNYYAWSKVVNGEVSVSTTYATTDTVDAALSWIASAPEPWLCYVAFNAPHGPFHAPPAGLHSVDLPDVDPRFAPRPFYKAAVEALDSELGRLLAGVEALGATPNVVFFGDNGTPQEVSLAPFLPEHAKLTVYEGGLNVPLILSGPAVPQAGAWCNALVNTSDLFATLLDLAGAQLPAPLVPEDSLSLLPYLADPARPSLRRFVFSEMFQPNGPPPLHLRRRALRGARYKLIRSEYNSQGDEFYDLWLDRFEAHDLLAAGEPPLGPAAALALQQLVFELERLEALEGL